MILRRASITDVDGMLAVKRALRLDAGAADAARGGFLLGASAEQYAFFVHHANVHVLGDVDGSIAGFAVALPDAVLRGTELWARRRSIAWDGDGGDADGWDALETSPVAYFDQLAVRPGQRSRGYAPALAWAALDALAAMGHRHVFATTVREPVLNRASHTLLRAAGARRVGEIGEVYPEVGRILSDVYHLPIDRETTRKLVESNRAGRRVARMVGRLAVAG
jgi:GNAT superfamily N-acetyltransferase